MTAALSKSFTAFLGNRMIASGELAEVAMKVRRGLDRSKSATALVFDDSNGRTVEIDCRGSAKDVGARYAGSDLPGETTDAPRGPGRPKLGVVAREVTLLPRHWEWLASQPGGASVALRRLVEDARKRNAPKDRIRQGQESAYRFISTIAGDLPGFEEATRALFAGDADRFDVLVKPWPADIARHARRLAGPALASGAT